MSTAKIPLNVVLQPYFHDKNHGKILLSDSVKGFEIYAEMVYTRFQSMHLYIKDKTGFCPERNQGFMEKIASFTIDHIRLLPGVYVSRKDTVGQEVITTFDLRMTSPNDEPVMNTAEVHTIEHLGATFLRNHSDYKNKIIYFGPMGCRTGFYLLIAGDYHSRDIVPLVTQMFEFIRDYRGEVPGASPMDCGNYLDMNLNMANYLAERYLDRILYQIDDSPLIYPQ